MEFEVHDICIGQKFTVHREHNGMECQIIGGLKKREWRSAHDGTTKTCLTYLVEWENGKITLQQPYTLKKKPPPKKPKKRERKIDKVVSWDDCAWKPTKETV